MTLRPLTEHNLECLSLKGGYAGSSESTLVIMPHYWKLILASTWDLIRMALESSKYSDKSVLSRSLDIAVAIRIYIIWVSS